MRLPALKLWHGEVIPTSSICHAFVKNRYANLIILPLKLRKVLTSTASLIVEVDVPFWNCRARIFKAPGGWFCKALFDLAKWAAVMPVYACVQDPVPGRPGRVNIGGFPVFGQQKFRANPFPPRSRCSIRPSSSFTGEGSTSLNKTLKNHV
jgi:hypothetical protein